MLSWFPRIWIRIQDQQNLNEAANLTRTFGTREHPDQLRDLICISCMRFSYIKCNSCVSFLVALIQKQSIVNCGVGLSENSKVASASKHEKMSANKVLYNNVKRSPMKYIFNKKPPHSASSCFVLFF